MAGGLATKSSDIHIEPEADSCTSAIPTWWCTCRSCEVWYGNPLD